MRAYGFTAIGGVEKEQFFDVPEPVAGDGELVVRVRAAGINPGDWRMREGSYGDVAPAVLGREVAGTVTAVGPGVDGFSVGDEPYRGGMLRTTGKIVPALRAVLDGVKGASTRSARAMP